MFYVFKARPQGCNYTSAFVFKICEVFERSETVNFLGFIVNGLSCKSDDI